jgi:5S rRNA maturation endonuclease (ribonuclease M5)
MTSRNAWRRVSPKRPCPICQKPDWCLVATDDSAGICARVESPRRCGDAGWLHRFNDDAPRPRWRGVQMVVVSRSGPPLDLGLLSASFRKALDGDQLQKLARSLGLTVNSLTALGIGWSAHHRAWSFPMTDAAGNVLGIRLRRPNGFKFSVAGGRDGLFLPASPMISNSPMITNGRLLVCEGATDTAALLDLGFCGVVGRPNCAGGVRLLVDLVQKWQPKEVVIIADADEPGRRGADYLASVLTAYVAALLTIRTPDGIKDVRAWLQAGATHHDVEHRIRTAPPRRLSVRSSVSNCEKR